MQARKHVAILSSGSVPPDEGPLRTCHIRSYHSRIKAAGANRITTPRRGRIASPCGALGLGVFHSNAAENAQLPQLDRTLNIGSGDCLAEFRATRQGVDITIIG